VVSHRDIPSPDAVYSLFIRAWPQVGPFHGHGLVGSTVKSTVKYPVKCTVTRPVKHTVKQPVKSDHVHGACSSRAIRLARSSQWNAVPALLLDQQ
jgi:hypothetical protein